MGDRRSLQVDIADLLGSVEPIFMRGWLSLPDEVGKASGPLIYCVAGGGCSTSYFDLQVSGLADYSMADYLCAHDASVAAFDTPGIGESDPVPDLFEITPSVAARCHDRAVREVVSILGQRTGSPLPSSEVKPFVVGVGHSMGGLIVTLQQSMCRSFDALILMGHSGLGLPEVLTAEERSLADQGRNLLDVEDEIVSLARTRFDVASSVPRQQPAHGVFFADDVPQAVRDACAAYAVPLLFTCGLTALIPNVASAQLARIDVPVFLAFGDHDLTDKPFDALLAYASATDATVYVLPRSGHCHNQASGRLQLWGRLLRWICQFRPTEG